MAGVKAHVVVNYMLCINAPTIHWTFPAKTHIWKIRIIFFSYFQWSVFLIIVKIWTPVFTFHFWLINLWRKQCAYIVRIIRILYSMIVLQVSLNFDPAINTENTVSDLYFNEESDYSEENTSDNEDFHSTIIQPF